MKKITTIIAVLAIAASLTACSENNSPTESIPGNSSAAQSSSSLNSSGQSNDAAQSSQQSSSDASGSDPANDDYVMDKDILNKVILIKDGLPEFKPLYTTTGLNCKTLLGVHSDASVGGVYCTKDGAAIWLSDLPDYHYIWIDAEGNELDRVGFNFADKKDTIPDRDYPGTGIFKPSSDYGNGAYYYQSGKLQKNVTLPQCHRADLIQEKSQYLYIDPEQKNLTLYDLENESAVKTLSAENLGLEGNSWVFDFVHAVTPNLATVTLIEYDANKTGEYNGSENFRTFLLELPTLKTVQKLPDATELIALDDSNFIMTKREGDIRTVSLAKLDGETLTETKTNLTINEVSQFFNSSNIVLSPNKKVALLRDWVNEKDGSSLRCRAVSTDSMQVLWEFRASSESEISVGYPAAAITDDAVLYMFNQPADSSDKLLYCVSANK